MLRRFADARLRSDLDKAHDARDQARDTARRLFARLKATRHALETQAALTERWKTIAQQSQADRDFARAEAKNIYGTLKTIESERNAACALAAELLRDEQAAERARTQETAGRCGDVAPSLSLLAGRIRPTCRLTAGHAGWHRGDDDSEWTMTQETQP